MSARAGLHKAGAYERKGLAYAALQKGDDNSSHIVAYGGQALNRSQEKDTASELELMSVVLALKHYQTLLVRRHVTMVTDNTTVLHLDRFTPANARQTRLLAFLMQFQVTVKFVRGCKNYTADTLSRLFDEMPNEQKAHFMADTDDKTDFIVSVSDKDKPDDQNARSAECSKTYH